MAIQIELVGAAFKCKMDEDIFYLSLSEIAGIQKVIMNDTKLQVTVDKAQENQAVTEINAICDMWNVSYRISE